MNLPSTIFLLNILIGTFEISIQINGGRVLRGPFTHHVLIRRSKEIICHGALIDETHVLTAASCVDHFQKSEFRVIAGKRHPHDQLQVKKVEKIHLHPFFFQVINSWGKNPDRRYKNNIAVLTLFTAFCITPTLQPAQLSHLSVIPNLDSFPDCAIVRGIRRTESTRRCIRLLPIDIRILCSIENLLSPAMTYINEFAAIDPSNGTVLSEQNDYGTPLVCDGVIVGILIYTKYFQPSIFLDIAYYLEFINEIIANESPVL